MGGKCILEFLNEDEYYRIVGSCGGTVPLRYLKQAGEQKVQQEQDPTADQKEPGQEHRSTTKRII